MADDVTLLPCPFCGGTTYVNDNDIWTYMECECGAQGPQADTKAEAREVWNSRVSDPRIAALEREVQERRSFAGKVLHASNELREQLTAAQARVAALEAELAAGREGTRETCAHCYEYEGALSCGLTESGRAIAHMMDCSYWEPKEDA